MAILNGHNGPCVHRHVGRAYRSEQGRVGTVLQRAHVIQQQHKTKFVIWENVLVREK